MTRNDEGAKRAVIEVRGVTKDFAKAGSLLRRGETISALSDVVLDVRSGEWLGLVGESGSGKSTLARIIAGLETATSGTVTVAGQDVAKQSRADRRAFARRVQFVYQDSIGALNPRWTALELVAEPLRIHGAAGRKAVPTQTLVDLLSDVGLDPSIGSKRPGQLSGGQCQRINLARALALDPDILLLDEPTSALDVSVQSQIIALLREVQKARGLSVVLISHDLALVSQTCQRLAVMYLGTIVETGSTADIVASPQHPYTAQLLDAVPRLGDDVAPHAPPARDATEPPDPSAPPSGCRYRTRCAKADALCADVRPGLEWDARSTRAFACHHPLSDTTHRGHV